MSVVCAKVVFSTPCRWIVGEPRAKPAARGEACASAAAVVLCCAVLCCVVLCCAVLHVYFFRSPSHEHPL